MHFITVIIGLSNLFLCSCRLEIVYSLFDILWELFNKMDLNWFIVSRLVSSVTVSTRMSPFSRMSRGNFVPNNRLSKHTGMRYRYRRPFKKLHKTDRETKRKTRSSCTVAGRMLSIWNCVRGARLEATIAPWQSTRMNLILSVQGPSESKTMADGWSEWPLSVEPYKPGSRLQPNLAWLWITWVFFWTRCPVDKQVLKLMAE